MSKINAVRFINLNYNNNANKIEDETLTLDGDSTLLSLANGGGKTVLVQMMMAPFVRKRYRNTTDRTFESFFTSMLPTIILVEWILDGGAGFVLTGMVVRKKQSGEEEDTQEDLEMINFVHEYRDKNEYDLYSIPFVETESRQKKLLSFGGCRKVLEEARQLKGIRFDSYDMGQSMRQRQYFQKLREFGIHAQEWESIIKRINLKESGLSELFKEAKDESGLVEKWFLPAIETKLNKEENRVLQFRNMMTRFIRQYKENEVKIHQKEVIQRFHQDTVMIVKTAEECITVKTETETCLDQIIYLREQVELFLNEAKKKEFVSQVQLKELESNLKRVRYEEISYKIHQLQDQLEFLTYEYQRTSEQKDLETRNKKQLEKEQHILECARIKEEVHEAWLEMESYRVRIDLSREEEENLLPERLDLGHTLLQNYQAKYMDELKKMESLNNVRVRIEADKVQATEELAREQALSSGYLEKLGNYRAERNQYDEQEADFCRSFSCVLERNILGNYEDDTLECLEVDVNNVLQKLSREIQSDTSKRQKLEEQREEVLRTTQDAVSEQGSLSEYRKMLQQRRHQYEGELEQRIKYLQYVSLQEDSKFDTDKIIEKFADKINTLRDGYYAMERDLIRNREELQKLRNGVVFDIPEAFIQLLHSLDIFYTTGMEYLKKNGQSEAQNQELVRKIPLLPYSILLSEKELARLSREQADFFTAVPIPILIREHLNQFHDRDEHNIYTEGNVHFFILFNQHLLNEQDLTVMLTKKEEQIQRIEEKMEQRQQELSLYETMRQSVSNQEISKEKLEILLQEQEYTSQSLTEKEELILSLRKKKADQEGQIKVLFEKIQEQSQILKQKELMQGSLTRLKEKYKKYAQAGIQIEILQNKLKQLRESAETWNRKINSSFQQIIDTQHEIVHAEQEVSQFQNKIQKYSTYTVGKYLGAGLEQYESRFDAITEGVSRELKFLEKTLEESQGRYQKHNQNLEEKCEKYQLESDDYETITFSKLQMQNLDLRLQEINRRIDTISAEYVRLEKEMAVCDSQIAREYEELKGKFEKESPVAKEYITDTQFQKRIREIRTLWDNENEYFKEFRERRSGYEANLSALSEFSYQHSEHEYDFVEKLEKYHIGILSDLDRKDMEDMYGSMIREYRTIQKQLEKKYIQMDKCIDNVIYMQQYKEEFYRQPLQLLKNLCEKPEELLQQLKITLHSFQILLDKLEVDIQFIDQEEEKLQELLFDYVFEIHKNLEKIDRNSTIPVKDRSIKMLRIQVPSWEENREIYWQRQTAFVKELIAAGLTCIEENHNMEELLALRMTTKTLYDAIPGIASTGIRLYKIEAQREFPITWAEVSKNSGGEGFLSAFVVLVCLLSYMRRDESELMIEREEGKVIIMDNPFAQTNASHLLIPLMDIARKSNTQLICLTGLGGESIYNRFDNIYVLNLIESGLQSGVQYLKAEQVKGDTKIYEMTSSRIQVEESEQMELLF